MLSPQEIADTYAAGQNGRSILDAVAPSFVTPEPEDVTVDPITGDVTFNFATDAGLTYRVYSSPDLRTWTLIDTITGTGSSYRFSHDGARNNTPHQYYRIE